MSEWWEEAPIAKEGEASKASGEAAEDAWWLEAPEVDSSTPETVAEEESQAVSEPVTEPEQQAEKAETEKQARSSIEDALAAAIGFEEEEPEAEQAEPVESTAPPEEDSQLVDSRLLIDSQLLTDEELLRESQLLESSELTDSQLYSESPSHASELMHFDMSARKKAEADKKKQAQSKEQVRVNADLLDKLVNNAGEVSIFRSRIEQQNSTMGFNLAELEQTVERLHNQLRQLEIETEAQILFRYEKENIEDLEYQKDFDPLELDRFSAIQELSRALSETTNDLVSIKSAMDDLSRETDTLLLQQSRVATDLQDGLLRTRMVPVSAQMNRLQRVVRQTARTLGKKARLEIGGTVGEMDRTILDNIMGPLEHLLRNAVGHGIENPQDREAAGKPDEGLVSMTLEREGTEILLSIADDGRGLNLDSIRERAIDRGLMDTESELDDEAVMQFILEPGFSTASEVTQISGRGVGMDVVASQVKQLGGTLEIDSAPGRGTSFNIHLPYTLAISDAMLVRVGEETYAVPHTAIEGVIRVPRDRIEAVHNGESVEVEYTDHHYQVRYLGAILGLSHGGLVEQNRSYPVLLVRSGENRMALQVDHLIGNRQIVVKSVGAQLSTVRWITGGTILGDGRVALIIDVNALVRSGIAHHGVQETAEPEDVSAGVTVMVVDDSITVRKVTSRLLARHNMEVITAKDGVDALEVLQDKMPDVMLLDIEMPRMDGFELARHMKNRDDLKHIPIIMITSRTGEKHKNRALDIGVNSYLGKPYQEEELLENIYLALAEAEA